MKDKKLIILWFQGLFPCIIYTEQRFQNKTFWFQKLRFFSYTLFGVMFQLTLLKKRSRSVRSDSLRPHGQQPAPGSSVHGIFQARVLEWVAISFSRESSRPRDQTQVSHIDRQTPYHLSHQGSLLLNKSSLYFLGHYFLSLNSFCDKTQIALVAQCYLHKHKVGFIILWFRNHSLLIEGMLWNVGD